MIGFLLGFIMMMFASVVSYYFGRKDGEKNKRVIEWHSFNTDSGEVHTMPVYDGVTHSASDTCFCRPETEYKESLSAWSIMHNDAKERAES